MRPGWLIGVRTFIVGLNLNLLGIEPRCKKSENLGIGMIECHGLLGCLSKVSTLLVMISVPQWVEDEELEEENIQRWQQSKASSSKESPCEERTSFPSLQSLRWWVVDFWFRSAKERKCEDVFSLLDRRRFSGRWTLCLERWWSGFLAGGTRLRHLVWTWAVRVTTQSGDGVVCRCCGRAKGEAEDRWLFDARKQGS